MARVVEPEQVLQEVAEIELEQAQEAAAAGPAPEPEPTPASVMRPTPPSMLRLLNANEAEDGADADAEQLAEPAGHPGRTHGT